MTVEEMTRYVAGEWDGYESKMFDSRSDESESISTTTKPITDSEISPPLVSSETQDVQNMVEPDLVVEPPVQNMDGLDLVVAPPADEEGANDTEPEKAASDAEVVNASTENDSTPLLADVVSINMSEMSGETRKTIAEALARQRRIDQYVPEARGGDQSSMAQPLEIANAPTEAASATEPEKAVHDNVRATVVEEKRSTLEQDRLEQERERDSLQQERRRLEELKEALEQDRLRQEQDRRQLEKQRSALEQDRPGQDRETEALQERRRLEEQERRRLEEQDRRRHDAVADAPAKPDATAVEPAPHDAVADEPLPDVPSEPVADALTEPMPDAVADAPTKPDASAVEPASNDAVADVPTEPVADALTEPLPDVPTEPMADALTEPLPDVPTQSVDATAVEPQPEPRALAATRAQIVPKARIATTTTAAPQQEVETDAVAPQAATSEEPHLQTKEDIEKMFQKKAVGEETEAEMEERIRRSFLAPATSLAPTTTLHPETLEEMEARIRKEIMSRRVEDILR